MRMIELIIKKKRSLSTKYSIYFLLIIYAVGIAGHVYSGSRNLMVELTPFTLLLTSGVVLVNLFFSENIKLFSWIGIVFLVTFIAEVIGVKTGLIFGDYFYGDVLGFKYFEVPLIIGLNWVLIILGAIKIAEENTKNKTGIVFVAGLIALLFDITLEPTAMHLNYWQWTGGAIPLQNYIAWVLITIVAALLFIAMKVRIKSRLPKYYLFIQFFFFLALLIFLK